MGVYVIAEAGVNHNGSIERALALVDAAADAGADAVKFQTFDPAALVTATARQAKYQIENQGDVGSQLEMLRGLQLDHDDHRRLQARAGKRDIDFLSTPFDLGSADFLIDGLGLGRVKLGSGEVTNGPMLFHVSSRGVPVILSTGMATLDEVDEALGVLAHGYVLGRPPTGRAELAQLIHDPAIRAELAERVVLLHCTTQYPCDPADVNLRAMGTLADHTGLPVGYSDHTMGNEVAVGAAALGAVVVEKHVTLDRMLPGPDHAASVEPDEFAALVAAVRTISSALGSATKQRQAVEEENVQAGRRSIVAARSLSAGTTITEGDITAKRPASARSPMDWWDVVGTTIPFDVAEDDPVP